MAIVNLEHDQELTVSYYKLEHIYGNLSTRLYIEALLLFALYAAVDL